MGAYVVTRASAASTRCAFFEEATGSQDADTTLYHRHPVQYLGVSDGRPIWGTLWMLAIVLAAVIVVASVSLIYNAFSISVAERTRQFGLLASVGASKRQLRRMVLFEALLIGAVGVPLGLVLGVAGTVGAFAASQEAFTALRRGHRRRRARARGRRRARRRGGAVVGDARGERLRRPQARGPRVGRRRHPSDPGRSRLEARAHPQGGRAAGTQVRMGAAGSSSACPGSWRTAISRSASAGAPSWRRSR